MIPVYRSPDVMTQGLPYDDPDDIYYCYLALLRLA